MTDTSKAPRCFGSPTAFDAAMEECASCEFRPGCEPRATAAAAKIQELLRAAIKRQASKTVVKGGLRESFKNRRKPQTVSAASIEGLSKNAQRLVSRLRGRDLLSPLRAGENPFGSKEPQFLRVIAEELKAGPVTKQMLRDCLCKTLNWTDATAGSHVSFAVAALVHLGVVQENAGAIYLKES